MTPREAEGLAGVAALVVAFNSGDELRQCVDSLLNALAPSAIFIADNATNDDCAEGLSKSVRVIRFDRNIGYCGAMNRLIAEATAAGFNYGLAINPDARIEKDSLYRMTDAMARDPKLAIVYPKVLRRHQAGVLDGAWLELTWRHLATRFVGENEADAPRWNVVRPVLAGHGCCALLRLAAIWGEGGYDEEFFAYQDEVDLGLRLSRSGYTVLYAPLAVARHAGPAHDRARNDLKAYFLARNSVGLCRKHARGLDRWKFWAWMLMGMVFHGAGALMGNSRSKRIREGWADGFARRRRYPEENHR